VTDPAPLAVLYEDAHLLAVDKPAGLATQGPAGGGPTLEGAVRHHLAGGGDPAGVYLGTVHRLDRPVTGVVIWAKTIKAARRLAGQFAGRTVEKVYWALVEARPATDTGTWADWLCEEETGLGRVQVLDRAAPRSRRAVTAYRLAGAATLDDGQAAWWLELRPETGRRHQLRAQSAARGLPIVGDRAYAAARAFGAGIALHARRLVVEHPARLDRLVVEATLPSSWPALSG